MATCSSLSHRLLCTHSQSHSSSSSSSSSKQHTNSSSNKSQNVTRNRFKTLLKSSPKKNTSTSLDTSPRKQTIKRLDGPGPTRFSLSDSFSLIVSRLREGFKVDELGSEIWSIALPAALALAADPITSLVDTAFVGHLGSVELAAVGVSVSVFNLVSKLFNVPLLNITTSFVAEEQTLNSQGNGDSSQIGDDYVVEQRGKKLLPSVSTSLALAASLGIAEAVALSFGSGFLINILGIQACCLGLYLFATDIIMCKISPLALLALAASLGIAEAVALSFGPGVLINVLGIPADSPMRVPAENFLTLRAFGAPPIVIALAAQGAGNLLNAILDVILIFLFHFGVSGAAVATVISEYVNNVIFDRFYPSVEIEWQGGLLIGRTIAVLLIMTLSTSLAAREGPIPMAGHQICIEVWLAVSLLTDALALAGQALLAGGYSQGNYEQARQVVFRLLQQMGLITGIGLAGFLFLGFGAFSHLFTTDSEVLKIAWSGILFVAGSQPMNALAFVLDGLYYGVSDFGYAAYSMILVAAISSIFLLVAAPVFGLAGIWAGLFLFMTLRVVVGLWRLGTKSGPWEMVWSETEMEQK
ncbi:hypothetical protein EZV62_016724 [Acer yangbiense]|uniref:Protein DETOXIFICATION n=1 Tax=Acer yangbiense TaxID=1000413 RepID=A0A5C7HQ58_9ROSI|nr:hypothetical protein EZV62_016724 [Acer yangbiense]